MVVWFWNRSTTPKSHFYVWYLGSREAEGVRGQSVVLPAMRQLLRESFRKSPNKATVQVSGKGLKLVQSVVTMSKAGKVKMQLVKIGVAANCITFSMTGKAPFDDVVGVVMLVLNPEAMNPLHVHCYRCDSAESAAMLQANLQMLIGRPENQKSIVALEHRLFLSGVLQPKMPDSLNLHLGGVGGGTARRERKLQSELHAHVRMREKRREGDAISLDAGTLLAPPGPSNVPSHIRNKRYSVNDLPSAVEEPRLFRHFGDTMARSTRARSVDGLNQLCTVSKNLSGDVPLHVRTSSGEQFGRAYEHSLGLDALWKQQRHFEPRRNRA